jgi:hypothetical protein
MLRMNDLTAGMRVAPPTNRTLDRGARALGLITGCTCNKVLAQGSSCVNCQQDSWSHELLQSQLHHCHPGRCPAIWQAWSTTPNRKHASFLAPAHPPTHPPTWVFHAGTPRALSSSRFTSASAVTAFKSTPAAQHACKCTQSQRLAVLRTCHAAIFLPPFSTSRACSSPCRSGKECAECSRAWSSCQHVGMVADGVGPTWSSGRRARLHRGSASASSWARVSTTWRGPPPGPPTGILQSAQGTCRGNTGCAASAM